MSWELSLLIRDYVSRPMDETLKNPPLFHSWFPSKLYIVLIPFSQLHLFVNFFLAYPHVTFFHSVFRLFFILTLILYFPTGPWNRFCIYHFNFTILSFFCLTFYWPILSIASIQTTNFQNNTDMEWRWMPRFNETEKQLFAVQSIQHNINIQHSHMFVLYTMTLLVFCFLHSHWAKARKAYDKMISSYMIREDGQNGPLYI